MLVTCLNDKYDKQLLVLPTNENNSVKFDELIIGSGWYSISQQLVGYSITAGKEYWVYGILQYDGQLYYLIQDEDAMAVFVPHSLMKICDNTMPFDWSINAFELEKGTLLIIGYNQLTINYKAVCDLAEQKGIAVRHFLEYKAQVARWE